MKINKNPSRYRLWKEMESFAASIPKGSMVLDAGSGDAPYKSLFKHVYYQNTDFLKINKMYEMPTFICDLTNIPVKSNYYDINVFTQVIEHLSDPKQTLSELFRVLKPGGKMFLSGPFFFEEHEQPYDFYRFTQYGLRYLLNTAGFIIERIDWLEGYFGTVSYQLKIMAWNIPYNPRDFDLGFVGYILVPFMMFIKVFFAFLSLLFTELEIHKKYTHKGFPKNFVVVVRKPM